MSIFLFIALFNSKPSPKTQAIEERAWSVQSQRAVIATYSPRIQLYGQVISQQNVQLTSQIEAKITQKHVNVGDIVIKGQLLLTLDDVRLNHLLAQRLAEQEEAQLMIDKELAQVKTDRRQLKFEKNLLKIAKNTVKRTKTLEKSLMASSAQIDDNQRLEIQQEMSINKLEAKITDHSNRLKQLRAKYKQITARVNLAQDDLTYSKVSSPVNGVITAISADIGEVMRKGNALISISDTDNIEIQSLIPQRQFHLLNELYQHKQTVVGTIKLNKQRIKTQLSRLPNVINDDMATSYAFFEIKKAGAPLIIGQTVELLIELAPIAKGIALPHDALYGVDSIFLIKDERLVRTKVDWLGETWVDGKQFILVQNETINPDDEILVSKFANARQGLKVKSSRTINRNSSETKQKDPSS